MLGQPYGGYPRIANRENDEDTMSSMRSTLLAIRTIFLTLLIVYRNSPLVRFPDFQYLFSLLLSCHEAPLRPSLSV